VIGEDLGVVPPSIVAPVCNIMDNTKQEFSPTVMPDQVRIDWEKGRFDGIVVQSKRGTETTFTSLDKDTSSPFEDKRPNVTPNLHEESIYRLRYLIKDAEVGQWSDELKVFCVL
jgi:hypothetical protein